MDSYKIKLGVSGVKKAIDKYPIIIKKEWLCDCFGFLDRFGILVNKLNNYMLRFING